jgi:hypothetical protein
MAAGGECEEVLRSAGVAHAETNMPDKTGDVGITLVAVAGSAHGRPPRRR